VRALLTEVGQRQHAPSGGPLVPLVRSVHVLLDEVGRGLGAWTPIQGTRTENNQGTRTRNNQGTSRELRHRGMCWKFKCTGNTHRAVSEQSGNLWGWEPCQKSRSTFTERLGNIEGTWCRRIRECSDQRRSPKSHVTGMDMSSTTWLMRSEGTMSSNRSRRTSSGTLATT
jgi:hypothetical protein